MTPSGKCLCYRSSTSLLTVYEFTTLGLSLGLSLLLPLDVCFIKLGSTWLRRTSGEIRLSYQTGPVWTCSEIWGEARVSFWPRTLVQTFEEAFRILAGSNRCRATWCCPTLNEVLFKQNPGSLELLQYEPSCWVSCAHLGHEVIQTSPRAVSLVF